VQEIVGGEMQNEFEGIVAIFMHVQQAGRPWRTVDRNKQWQV
jgi:hypothetical protein